MRLALWKFCFAVIIASYSFSANATASQPVKFSSGGDVNSFVGGKSDRLVGVDVHLGLNKNRAEKYKNWDVEGKMMSKKSSRSSVPKKKTLAIRKTSSLRKRSR